ncbi:class I SAM-dependent RNA methyltransferase [Erythrobacter sp. YT30]|uniref:class I SAM-dependent RNA methyltransferase n=1 Tax=Erythrobacter sp. YT30 TaxID=1735012 RepID=UPI00076D36E5|nr:class I SAM-dependent RNA methyltransferase [Erythrobacter sp. YT30]KWV93086.1 RNA methyltransferase [Erythrobacter sp. YT30]
MSEYETIVRIAAKGDGVTESGRHAAGTLPGDVIDASGVIIDRGPRHQEPPCQHFGTCGGCQLQHADNAALAAFVRDRVVNAALGQGLEIDEELPVHLSPPKARRRTTLHAIRTQKSAIIGFRESGSHKIVDCRECPVLHPSLADLIDPVRSLIARYGPKGAVDVQMTVCDTGVDVGFTHFPLEGLEAIEAMSDFARERGLARVTIDQGYGPETQWEPEPVTVTLGGIPVPFPSGSFLQATEDAEDRMIADAQEFLGDAKKVADLFSGLGTFALNVREGRKFLAAEADRSAHLALKSVAARARGNVYPIHRDLFRNPLQSAELNNFDAVLLDPPRAGARSQVQEMAASDCEKVVYVSCNPSSWARDGSVMAEAGFRLSKLRPVGQFRWSTHVELVSLFERN